MTRDHCGEISDIFGASVWMTCVHGQDFRAFLMAPTWEAASQGTDGREHDYVRSKKLIKGLRHISFGVSLHLSSEVLQWRGSKNIRQS